MESIPPLPGEGDIEPASVSAADPRGDQAASASGNVFRRDGRHWEISFEGRSVRLRNIKGLGYVAELLRNPGERVHVAMLFRGGEVGFASALPALGQAAGSEVIEPENRERMRKAVTNRMRDAIARIRREHDALGNHLAKGIRMGSFCSYAPGRTVNWVF